MRAMTTTSARRLPRTAPESAGVDPAALADLVHRLDALGGAHSLMVLRHGSVVAESWWAPHAPEHRHLMFSVSKAFTAVAVGLAVAEGRLSLDDRVVDLLPDDVPADPGPPLRAMRVRHLLTMTSGHVADSLRAAERRRDRPTGRWVQAVLADPVEHEPGTLFVYDTGATYLLSAILHRLTGERLLDYLRPRLLEPLGIHGATWEQDPDGIDLGGTGLAVTTEDLAAFGELLLRRGRWGDRQLVPEAWVDAAAAWQVDSAPQQWDADWQLGYGYQLWRCTPSGAYRADGAFGQLAVVWPEHDAVVVLTSGSAHVQGQLGAVWASLRGAFAPAPGAGGGAGGEPLTFPDLAAPVPTGQARSPREADLLDASWRLAGEGPASAELPDLRVRREADDVLVVDAGGRTVRCGHGRWLTGGLDAGSEEAAGGDAVAAAYAWTAPDELEVRVARLGSPYTWTTRVAVGHGDVEVTVDQNVAFGATRLLKAVGTPS